MNCENYIKFHNFFKIFDTYKEKNIPKTKSFYGIEGHNDNNAIEFRQNIRQGLSQCKIFEVTDSIKRLLVLTRTPKINEGLNLPYDSVFIDVSFTKEELEDCGVDIDAERIIGILFGKGTLIDTDGMIVGEDLRITMLSENFKIDKDYPLWFDSFNKNANLVDEYKDKEVEVLENPTTDKKAREFIYRFVLNFLNFVNNPEIEIVENVRSEKNQERRLKKGLPIIPSSSIIILNGKLKQYVSDLENNPQWHYNYRFWVKGHYRNLRSDKYKEKKRLWILPFVKGQGVLIEKRYLLKQKNGVGENG